MMALRAAPATSPRDGGAEDAEDAASPPRWAFAASSMLLMQRPVSNPKDDSAFALRRRSVYRSFFSNSAVSSSRRRRASERSRRASARACDAQCFGNPMPLSSFVSAPMAFAESRRYDSAPSPALPKSFSSAMNPSASFRSWILLTQAPPLRTPPPSPLPNSVTVSPSRKARRCGPVSPPFPIETNGASSTATTASPASVSTLSLIRTHPPRGSVASETFPGIPSRPSGRRQRSPPLPSSPTRTSSAPPLPHLSSSAAPGAR
mmetsp:Transcript_15490/g.38191  ORF Transcript_15490/g.38191 Transcript_15490/m.38191 type:complete len:262 (-) Transcript_15490:788-1573(-)